MTGPQVTRKEVIPKLFKTKYAGLCVLGTGDLLYFVCRLWFRTDRQSHGSTPQPSRTNCRV